MTKADESAIIEADKAHHNYEQTVQCRANLQANFLVLARLLKDNRDEGMFKFLGHDSFDSYLGSPELGFKRSTAYGLIHLVELYVDKLNVPADKLIAIGTSKLTKIASVVESNVSDWLDKAEHYSKSDLDEQISGRGVVLKNKSLPSSLSSSSSPALISPKQYLERVKSSPCCVCGNEPSTQAHFPRTKVRCEKPWMVIPLCGKCHREQEDGGMAWCWENRQRWARWFYNNIVGE